MDYTKLNKPDHLKDDVWRQHLEWLSVMGRQLKDNFLRHQARVAEDASRARALEAMHRQVMATPHRTRSMFCIRKD